MAQPGNFTPILLYASSTPGNVPLAANLTNSTTGSEIAINVADKNLFFKDSGGTVNTVPIRQSGTSSNGWLSSTDWNTFNSKAPATSGTSILYGNGSGGFSNVAIGSGITFAGGTLSATGSGGTVTSVTGTSPVVSSGGTTPVISMPAATTSVSGYLTSTDWNTFNNKQPAGTYLTAVSIISANGFAGTSSGGTTPALTLSTSITGLLKGNGTAISAATSGTDYAPATSGSSILYGNGAGGFSNVTIGTGLTFVGGTLASTASGGTVTSVAATVPAFLSISGSPITTSGTLAITLSGTALPVANGGTGLTSLTAGYVPYGNGTSAFSSSTNLKFDGTTLAVGGTQSAWSGVGNVVQLLGPSIWGSAGIAHHSRNTYFDGSNYKYITTDYAEDYYQLGGTHVWRAAVSGTAGATLSFIEYGRFNTSGNFLVGTTTASTSNTSFATANGGAIFGFGPAVGGPNNFYVLNQSGVGLYLATGNTSWTGTSDERLKTNLAPITDAANKVATLRAVTGRYLTDDKTKSRAFLIAQDVQKVLPEAVDASDPDKLGIQYTDVIPLLVAAINDIKTQFDAYVASHP